MEDELLKLQPPRPDFPKLLPDPETFRDQLDPSSESEPEGRWERWSTTVELPNGGKLHGDGEIFTPQSKE